MAENTSYNDWITVYAAVVASLALCWNIWVWFKNKGSLKIRAALVVDQGSYTEAAEAGITTRLLRVEATNFGNSPITISTIGGMTKKPKWHHLFQANPRFQLSNTTPPLPLKLAPTEPQSWLHEISGYEHLRKTVRIYVQDSTGKIWVATRKDSKQINQVLSKMRNIAS